MNIHERLAQVASINLTVDLSPLSKSEREIIPLLIEAAREMDDAFWIQAYGDKSQLLASTTDPGLRQYLLINYGPWDSVRDNEPFLPGAGSKPLGGNFYPRDISSAEFEARAALQLDLASKYTMVRRDIHGSLIAVPYHQFFRTQTQRAADRLLQAADRIDQTGLKAYLTSRADALLTDEYRDSDLAWMEMKDNTLDILIGPMETSADRWRGLKAAYAATILIKDHAWSHRLARYTRLLPYFQAQLPVPDAYKSEQTGLASDLNVYDILYCAGYDHASIPIGVNWPDDDEVRQRLGTRSLQLKNVMQAKFDKLVVPMADLLISKNQRQYVTFEAYFNFIMFHEIAHGLGIRQVISGSGSVKDRLKDLDHVIEESKANLLSLLIVTQLNQTGDVSDIEIREVYISALAHLFRLSDSRQALLQLNYFTEMGAYSRDPVTKTYRVNMERIPAAISSLVERLLRIQGDGNYAHASALLDGYAVMDVELEADIRRFESTGSPLEIVVMRVLRKLMYEYSL